MGNQNRISTLIIIILLLVVAYMSYKNSRIDHGEVKRLKTDYNEAMDAITRLKQERDSLNTNRVILFDEKDVYISKIDSLEKALTNINTNRDEKLIRINSAGTDQLVELLSERLSKIHDNK